MFLDAQNKFEELNSHYVKVTALDNEIHIRVATIDGTNFRAILKNESEFFISKGESPLYWSRNVIASEREVISPFARIYSRLFKRTLRKDFPPVILFPEELHTHKCNEAVARLVMESIEKRLLASFEKGATYTTVTMVAGYAAFISLYDKMIDKISNNTNLVVAISLGVSITCFILFEVYKIYHLSRLQVDASASLSKPSFEEMYEEILKQEFREKVTVSHFVKVWYFIFIIAAISGSVGAFSLLFAVIIAFLNRTI